MEMKKVFESTFPDCSAPEAYYIVGNFTGIFVISKYQFPNEKRFYLHAVDVSKKINLCLKADESFESLINIVNMLTYPSDKIYYQRCPEE